MDEPANQQQQAPTPSQAPPVQPAPAQPHHAQQHTDQSARTDGNVVYIGKKSVMGYVLAVVTQFNGGAQEIHIKARGKLISRAVDVAEIVRHRFLPEVKLGKIAIKTEEMDSEDGTKTKVSAIEITLGR